MDNSTSSAAAPTDYTFKAAIFQASSTSSAPETPKPNSTISWTCANASTKRDSSLMQASTRVREACEFFSKNYFPKFWNMKISEDVDENK